MESNLTICRQAVKVIKAAILKSQARAALSVTQEQLALYYGIGRFVSQNSRKDFWGTDAIGNISRLLREEMPGLKGFSAENIKLMRRFYEAWDKLEPNSVVRTTELQPMNDLSSAPNSVVQTTELQNVESEIDTIQKLQFTSYEEFPVTAFLNISFTHHITILRRVENVEERKYYIQLAFDQRLKVDDLEDMIKADVYKHRANLPNNFFRTIPDKRKALATLQTLKDEYLLDFINVEQIDEMNPDDIDESVIEKEIVMNIKNFIMTFGKYFTYRGHQIHYDKFGVDHWIDLLFFNRQLRSLVVIELKKGAFKPAYLGQLAAYLRILDDEEKLPDENPSVGIILCKKANKSFVEYVLQDYVRPMGVATYQTNLDKLKALLPPEEELKKLLPDDADTE